MKTIVAGIFFLAVLFSFTFPKRNFSKTTAVYPEVKKDSGFIQKEEAVKLLSQAKYDLGYIPEGRDTTDLYRADIKHSDTIGKYYRMSNGNQLAFIRDIIHPDRNVYVLMEITPKHGILQSEPYDAGNYICCWENKYDGLNRHGNDYFSIKTCGTGSGYCSGELNLFKRFAPQGGNGIYNYIWSTFCVYTDGPALACHLSSTMEIKNDTVTMYYTMEHLRERRNGKYKTVFSEKFDVKYVEREQGWVALDSTKIREFPY